MCTLEFYDFEIVDNHASNRKESASYYVSFYPVKEDGSKLNKYMINFRISDHDIPNLGQRSRRYYQNLADKHKRTSGKHQKFRLYSIIVNDQTFKTYEDALDYIEKLCENLIS